MKLDWDLLYKDDSAFPRLLHFGEFSDDRFRYGINEDFQHNLYFYFPADKNNKPIQALTMANVSFREDIIDGRAAVILTLLNENLKTLFNDLIGSLVLQTRQQESNGSKFAFISLCNEWFELFNPLASQLTKPDIQGIFAEVYFLKYLLTESKVSFNDILVGWKGPFGKGHDFELGDNLFEVKSRIENNPFVNISSEYQLDYLSGQNLLLVVCEFSNQVGEGINISTLIYETAAILRTQLGINMNVFWIALGKVRLTYSNLNDYDDYFFNLKSINSYRCNALNFPSVRRSLIPDAVRNVKYELALNVLDPFKQDDLTPFI